MKTSKIILLACFPLLFSRLFAQQADTIVAVSEISKVTVFLKGAQITRSAEVQLPKGECIVLFANMPKDIFANNFKIRGEDDCEILSFNRPSSKMLQHYNSLAEENIDEALENSLEKHRELLIQKATLNEEKKMILSNGRVEGMSAYELRQLADFFRERLTEIGNMIHELDKEINKHEEQEGKLRKGRTKPDAPYYFYKGSFVLVRVESKKAQKASMEVSYHSGTARWQPSYDLRVGGLDNMTKFSLKASINQQTQENWTETDLSLSTANPGANTNLPKAEPTVLYLSDNPIGSPGMEGREIQVPAEYSTRYRQYYFMTDTGLVHESVPEQYMQETTRVVEAKKSAEELVATNVTYKVEGKHSIPHDTHDYTIFINSIKPKVEYEHYCNPRLDNNAYLTVKLPDWEQYNLVDGRINLYFGGDFVGIAQLNTKSTKDTLVMSMGKDEKVAVERIWKGEKTLGSWGGNLEEQHAYQIRVLNKKNVPVNLLVEDQLPVSSTDEIRVEPTELSGAHREKETGKLLWRFRLDPGQSKEIDLAYSIHYPKDKILVSKQGK